MVEVFGLNFTASFIATLIYSVASFILFVVVCIYGWKRLLEQEHESDDLQTIHKKHSCRRYLQWIKLVWKMKSIYLSALVHIYDIATDVGIIVDWGIQAFDEKNGGPKENVRGLNMMGLFLSSIVAFFLYRFISAGFVFEFTGKFKRACIQFFDLEIYNAIYITHKLGRDEAGNLQRWLQKFEAIFESAPQSLLQLVYIVKTADYSELIISSIILSFFSVAARFTADDKIFFNSDAENLGLKWKKRKCKKSELLKDKNDANFEFNYEIKEDKNIRHKSFDPLKSTSSGNLAGNEVKVGEDSEDEDLLDKNIIESKEELIADNKYEILWSRWKMWNHIGFNRAYLFRYSFRMCDVFSRLMILALIWCTLNGTIAGLILAFEIFTFVTYAASIQKYNFFQFLVATYFSEDNRHQTVSYCFFRRMESLIYLIGVSIVVLFHDKYNKDTTIKCYKQYGGTVEQCIAVTDYDRTICDCNLETEVIATKILLIAAWSFGNLSGAVFFGAFHSMRQKFGTNERNIVNVMEKRDWEAFSEMLQFGYRMNRFDKKSNRSALSTFLDRVPSDKFDSDEIDRMIQLGGNINDKSIKPQDENDELEPDKIGDNVLIRYIKVTKCDIIDKEFETVVKKWTTDGVLGGDYIQNKDRIAVNINAKNNDGYTAFKVYWEKIQYKRREKQRIRKEIKYKIQCYKIDNEINDEKEINIYELTDGLNEITEQWFKNFYTNILKWKKLNADMATLTEDRISTLLAYIQDTNINDIDMDIVKLLCPLPINNTDDDDIKIDIDENSDSDNHVAQEIKMKAFSTWIDKYNIDKYIVVNDIQIWYDLGCCNNIQEMNLLSLYLQRCPINKQNKTDIELLINCGCSLENEGMKQYLSSRPLPMINIIDTGYGLKTKVERFDLAFGRWYDTKLGVGLYFDDAGDGKFLKWCLNRWRGGTRERAIAYAEKYFSETNYDRHPSYYMWEFAQDAYEAVGSSSKMTQLIDECWDNDQAYNGKGTPPINLDLLQFFKDKYQLEPERIDIKFVYDIDSYQTRLQKIIETQDNLTVKMIEKLLKMGYLIGYKDANPQKILYKATLNKKLPFDVFEFLLNVVLNNNDDEKEIELDYQIFNQWIQKNDNIEFSQIELLINKYGFSPYKSNADEYGCSVHFIWKNMNLKLEIMYQYWMAYGIKKFGKFENLYSGYLYLIMENKNLINTKQIDYLEKIFADCINIEEKHTGNHIIHYYCKNININIKILRYVVSKHKLLLNKTNKKDHHALHLICENPNLKIEYLRYFVEELGVPMDIKTHAGWQPFKALHYLIDNEAIKWSSFDVKIMIHNLNIDFANNRRAGEFILYRVSHQNNFSTQALIELYDYYKNEIDLNLLKSRKQLYWSKSSGGTTILMNLFKRTSIITPKQIIKLVTPKHKGGIGLDITAKDMENKGILHYASTKRLTGDNLKLIGKLLLQELGKDQFVIDIPDRSGATPFQLWISSIDTDIGNHMNIVEIWEDLGADITQSENKSAYNMLHNLLSSNNIWDIQLGYLRKMCFDDENPWISQEKKTKDDIISGVAKKPVNKYQIPLHAKPIPDNMTLCRLYTQTAVNAQEEININVLKFFKSKQPIVRFDLDSQASVLWYYMENVNININVLKYLIEVIGYKIQPQPQDNIAIRYMKYQNKRNKINWNILDYFFYDLKVDFKQKQNDYMTIIHEYSKNCKYFNCQEFEELIERYKLSDILWEKGQTDPTAASIFYEHRRLEIRPDIILCFKKLGYDICEPISNLTPIQHYCDLSDGHYINPKILQSFIIDGGAKLNYFIGRKQMNNNSIAQIITNSDAKIKYNKLLTLQMVMNEPFNIKLKNPNKRKQDIWYIFIQRFHSGHQVYTSFFEMFLKLMRIYINVNHEPIHLFHSNEIDENKKIKYKIYIVKDDQGYSQNDSQLKLKKNKKKLKNAKKFLNRIVFVTDDRDSVFRSVKVIDPRSNIDWEQIKIPQKWLQPITFSDFKKEINNFEFAYNNFQKSLKLADSNYFIDKQLIEKIIKLHNNNKEMINNIQLSDSQNILLKYIKTNHSTQLYPKDIDFMSQIGLDFKYGYSSSTDGLRTYVLYPENGLLNKSILDALIRGGCPINWDYEENDDNDNDDEKEKTKGEVIKTSYTTLHYYAMSEDANLDGFKKLIECGADIKIESAQNFTAVYYLLKHSLKINSEFIKYLAKDCKYNFNTPLSTTSTDERNSDTILFNMYLRENKNITIECIESLINIADCDANSRDDINDTSSIKSYLKNENLEKFNINIIKKLVELGSDVNEPDNEGIYPIQHLLQIQYTPLSLLIQYIKNMIEFGAKLQHILCDDSLVIQDYKLYMLQDMKQGYEHYNESWCTIDVWIWEYNSKKNKIQSAVALDETGANTKLYINIKRSNLIDITKKKLLNKYPLLKNVKNIMSQDKNNNENVFSDNEDDSDSEYDDNKMEEKEEEEEEEEEQQQQQENVLYVNNNNDKSENINDDQNNNNNITMEMANLVKT